MTFDEAKSRLIQLARSGGGTIAADTVERDSELAADREIVSAAAHALAGSTNVFATATESGTGWFPYAEIRFTDLH